MKIDAVTFAKSLARQAAAVRFHRYHRVQATAIHRTLEQCLGKTNPTDIARADAYAREVLGHARYAPWLYVYSAIAGCFKEGWIPDNFYGGVVVPKLKGGYGKVSSLKALQRPIFSCAAFPDIAYFANGLFIAPDNTPIAPDAVHLLLFAGRDTVVFKIDNSMQGKGIFFLDRTTFDVEKIKALGNGVFQEKIVQHETLRRFAPRSVATLRITTAVSDDGVPSIRACYLRLGRDVDTHVQSASNVRVAVDCTTGELSEVGYLPNWMRVREHPDSKVRFAGVTVPSFDQCVATVLALHRKVAFDRCVGWDVGVGHDGRVQLMEWNAEHNDIKFSEATQGPCFADLRWERLVLRETPRSSAVGSRVPASTGAAL
ncbi:sugar-transfer associated ATP-grasp domain-containing protein [Trinickia soli]|uniref:Alpha-L-glutamate ligase-related protein ATP-grasp domain-containing protein n=2 Tax=Trinickia soli TaxID=380675 RepID=A0A2N7VUZ6_9BURK|nr:sugar-transfer associated ATP-grasp domain-containing protein [Trinickia soli]PMS20978.1 hypothetical protein C0Z19_18955 [Trinickia soli]CAB3665028.1 hypothetical protein LMG24076_01648 [Trinickia soli]